MPQLNVGLLIPTLWSARVPSGSELTAFYRRAEELGFDSLWVPDRIFHDIAFPHPLTVLSHAAAVTTRMGLGTAVVLITARHPVELAQQAATLDALSGGRLTLGVGLGGRDWEYEAMGQTSAHRVGRMTEGVELMRRLWTERDVTFEGKYHTLSGVSLSIKPAQGTIPVPFGGAAEPALRRAGRMADGWIQGGFGTAAVFTNAWQTVGEAAHEAGRDPGQLTSGKLMYVNPGRDEAALTRELTRYLAGYYGEERASGQAAAAGSAEAIAGMVRGFIDAGCQTLMIGLPEPDLDKLEMLASEVVPLLR